MTIAHARSCPALVQQRATGDEGGNQQDKRQHATVCCESENGKRHRSESTHVRAESKYLNTYRIAAR